MKQLVLMLHQQRYQAMPLEKEIKLGILGLYVDKASSECTPIPVFCRDIYRENVLDVFFLL